MSKETIRQKLHEIIDLLEDKTALQQLYTDALASRYDCMEEDPPTEEEWAQIGEGLAQLRNDEPCTHTAVMKKFNDWQSKK